MKRTALKRYARLVAGRRRRLDRETDADREHKAVVMQMGRCLAAGYGPCSGPLQGAHLARSLGTGRPHGTARDIGPLCMGHHDQYDGRDTKGPLFLLGREVKFELGAGWIRECRTFVESVLAAEGAPF